MSRPQRGHPVEHGIGVVDREARAEIQKIRTFFMGKFKMLYESNQKLTHKVKKLKQRVEELEQNGSSTDYYTSGVDYDSEGNAIYHDDDGEYQDEALRAAIATRPR